MSSWEGGSKGVSPEFGRESTSPSVPGKEERKGRGEERGRGAKGGKGGKKARRKSKEGSR